MNVASFHVGYPLHMLGRLLSCLVFALAAGSAFAASVGVSVPPHRVPLGTPLFHEHVLGAYRFSFLLGPGPQPREALSPAMSALHAVLALAGVPMTDMPGMTATQLPSDPGPMIKTAGLSPGQDLAIEFALFAFLAPRLMRPTLRAVAELLAAHIQRAQWRSPLIHGPPRLTALPTV